MKVLVALSGGIDSVYLVYKLLQEQHTVTGMYIALDNNSTKVAYETEALKPIVQFFEDNFPSSFNYWGVGSSFAIHRLSGNSYAQPPIWLLGLRFASSPFDQVALGYVMNDDAISYLDELQNLWGSLTPFFDNTPQLVFPLAKSKKEKFIHLLPKTLYDACVFCENPQEGSICGECTPCLRRKHLELTNKISSTYFKVISSSKEKEETMNTLADSSTNTMDKRPRKDIA